jgi:hypothetical protein
MSTDYFTELGALHMCLAGQRKQGVSKIKLIGLTAISRPKNREKNKAVKKKIKKISSDKNNIPTRPVP